MEALTRDHDVPAATPKRERVQWAALCDLPEGARAVGQYQPDGAQRSFALMDRRGLVGVAVAVEVQPDVMRPVALLEVPDGAEITVLYRQDVNVTLGRSDLRVLGQEHGERVLVAGWRMRDGSKRESWLQVNEAGMVTVLADSGRPWPQD